MLQSRIAYTCPTTREHKQHNRSNFSFHADNKNVVSFNRNDGISPSARSKHRY